VKRRRICSVQWWDSV